MSVLRNGITYLKANKSHALVIDPCSHRKSQYKSATIMLLNDEINPDFTCNISKYRNEILLKQHLCMSTDEIVLLLYIACIYNMASLVDISRTGNSIEYGLPNAPMSVNICNKNMYWRLVTFFKCNVECDFSNDNFDMHVCYRKRSYVITIIITTCISVANTFTHHYKRKIIMGLFYVAAGSLLSKTFICNGVQTY